MHTEPDGYSAGRRKVGPTAFAQWPPFIPSVNTRIMPACLRGTAMTIDDQSFGGIARLYGREGLDRLRAAHVAVVGIGGVGSWAAEALARSGVGEISLFDLDDVCITNTNRQLHALDGTVGRPKVEVMAERIRAINPVCRVNAVADFVTRDSMAEHITERQD